MNSHSRSNPGSCHYLTVLFFGLTFLSGCAANRLAEVREELSGARGMVRAAELAGADRVAPQEIARVKHDLAAAERDIAIEPQTGRLSLDIQQKHDLIESSAATIETVQKGAIGILAKIDKEIHPCPATTVENAPTLSPPATTTVSAEEIEKRLRQELGREYALKLKNELEARANTPETTRQTEEIPAPKTVAANSPTNTLHDDLAQALARELPTIGVPGLKLVPETLSVRFSGEGMLFHKGSAKVRPELKQAVDRFVPALLKVVSQPEFRDHIKNIWVEGNTSSTFGRAKDFNGKYYYNLILSQNRTANAVKLLRKHPALAKNAILVGRLTPLGLSNTQPITKNDGSENQDQSRRLEIRIGLN